MDQAHTPGTAARLRDPDRHRLLDAIEALDAAASPQQLATCLDREVERLIPHGMLTCDLARASLGKSLDLQTVFSHGAAPEDLHKELRLALVERWLATQRPILLDRSRPAEGTGAEWPRSLQSFKFRNLALHAAGDMGGRLITTFCFAGIPEALQHRHERVLCLLVPHLRAALERAVRVMGRVATSGPRLSERQQELLRWIQMGKTNEELALILGMSHSNVKYHLRQIFKRMDVTSRTQAAYRFVEMKWDTPLAER